MRISYDIFAGAFLNKITEFEFLQLSEVDRQTIIDGFMKRAIASFKKSCKYNLTETANDETREFDIDIKSGDVDEIIDIISEGMVVQWLKPYVYKQENLENVLNTRDFTTYSPAELLLRIGNTYQKVQKDFKDAINEYSYTHGDLSQLHL